MGILIKKFYKQIVIMKYMLDKNDFKDLMIYALIIGIFILAAIVIKPVIFPIIYGILLGYIFYPLYRGLYKKTKMARS